MQEMIIVFSPSAFMQDLIIVFSQKFDLGQKYIKFNVTKHPFRHLDVTVRKQLKEGKSGYIHIQNNTAFVYVKHWITKLTDSKLYKKSLSALFNPRYDLNSHMYHLVVTMATQKS